MTPTLGTLRTGIITIDELRLQKQILLLVLSAGSREHVVRIAYSTLMARHLGELKTLGWLRISLYWPGMITKMKETCVSCGKCQKVEGRLQVNASLFYANYVGTI